MNIGLYWLSGIYLNLDGEGIGRYTLRLAEGLLRREDVNIIVVTDYCNMSRFESVFASVKARYPNRLVLVAAVHMEWVNAKLPVDVWVVPYIGLSQAIGLTKPYILCVHDLFYIHFPEEPRTQRICFLDQSVRALSGKAAAAIFNSEYIRDNEGLRYLNLPKERTHVIRLAPPTEEYDTFGLMPEEEFRAHYGLQGSYITFPSAIRPYKNHRRLIEAFLAFRQTEAGRYLRVSLLLTDNINRHEFRDEIRALADAYPDETVKQSVRCVRNRLPSNHLPSLYHYALGTIIPTLFEGSCPFPVFESLYEDTPVACSNIEVAQEVINDMSAVLAFDPYSVPDMTRAISQLCTVDSTLLMRQKQAVAGPLSRSWRDIADEYYTLCHNLTSKPAEGL